MFADRASYVVFSVSIGLSNLEASNVSRVPGDAEVGVVPAQHGAEPLPSFGHRTVFAIVHLLPQRLELCSHP